MSILGYHPSAKHKGEQLYEELGYAGDQAQMQGRRIEAVMIGREALALINAWLTETHGRPTALNEVSFCGREGIIILLDHEQPLRAVALAVV